jgi:hypothetical protein
MRRIQITAAVKDWTGLDLNHETNMEDWAPGNKP